MTDELIGELSRINSLKIISRTSVMQYKGEKRKSLENGTPRQLLGDEEDVVNKFRFGAEKLR
jgi:TolB-like protein